jgi:hypothetical protein
MPTAALKAFLLFLSSSRGSLSTIFCWGNEGISHSEIQNKKVKNTSSTARQDDALGTRQAQEHTLPISLSGTKFLTDDASPYGSTRLYLERGLLDWWCKLRWEVVVLVGYEKQDIMTVFIGRQRGREGHEAAKKAIERERSIA